ncbi:hypothetical protein MGN70_004542 [Eutypa lata]|nr:hypothetical protein MGN70_004542 [Eutypa lata]
MKPSGAFSKLRGNGKNPGPTFGWILCLNQNDIVEVNRQVSRMGGIYSGAQEVTVWLGDNSKKPPFVATLEGATSSLVNRQKIYRMNEYPDLFLLYWDCVWIIQEFALARKICIAEGAAFLQLDDYIFLFDTAYRSWSKNGIRLINSPEDMHMIHKLQTLRDEKTKKPLCELIRLFQGNQATRPADKIYGLLGLAAVNPDGTSPAELIDVNYDKEMFELFWDAAFECRLSQAQPEEQNRTITILQEIFSQDPGSMRATLETYRISARTSARHTKFAKIALQLSELFCVLRDCLPVEMKDLQLAPKHDGEVIPKSIFLDAVRIAWYISMHSIDARVTDPPRRLGEIAWFCSVHEPRSHVSSEKSSLKRLEYQLFACAVSDDHPFPEKLELACRNHSSSCGEGQIAFEDSEVGFRLILERTNVSNYFHSRGHFVYRLSFLFGPASSQGEQLL